MDRIIRIIEENEQPEIRLNKLMALLSDINAGYENTLFVFTEGCLADWTGPYRKPEGLRARRQGKTERTVRYNDTDPYVESWQTDWRNHTVCRAALKYFNTCLNEEERLVTATAYFPETFGKSRKDLFAAGKINRNRYYEIKRRAEEKLIRVWQLSEDRCDPYRVHSERSAGSRDKES